MTQPTATFLHLSDLHLGANLDDVGSGEKASLAWLPKLGGLRMQAHDPYIIWSLCTSVRAAARFVGSPDDVFDFVLVTGDISTNSDPEQRFEFARKFLSDKVLAEPPASVGLSVAASSLLCVPGNHDKLGQSVSPSHYLKFFDKYPSSLPFRKEVEIPRSKQRFIIYGIDSNLYAEANVAVGRVTPATLAWLTESFENDKQTADSTKILLLHHHPASLRKFRRRSLREFVKTVLGPVLPDLTRLEEGERLLDLCRGNVHIICHGHEHLPIVFIDDRSGCLIVSAGTTAQLHRGGEPNSFHTLRFDGPTLTVVEFDWDGSRFAPAWRWIRDLDSNYVDLYEEMLTGAQS